MNILIVGSGGREYAIALKLKKDSRVSNIFFATGNGATKKLGKNLDIKDFEELANFAIQNCIELTIIGPEEPLVNGIVDIFKSKGLTIFGPSKNASQLEGSKAFMKNFLKKHSIPTAKYIETSDLDEAIKFIDDLTTPIVVKADGLCAGKGVIIATSKDEAIEATKGMLSGNSFGNAGLKVVIEEFLDGYELSLFVISDGENYKILPPAQDHKRLLDGDKGVNTGGMGAYSPTPLINNELLAKIEQRIVKPSIDGMKNDGNPFEGVLFCGLMIVNGEPFVLEYNVRFGDPECEVLMPLIENPLDLFYKCATKDLNSLNITFDGRFAIGVVLASRDYPYKNSEPAKIVVKKEIENAHICYAGVSEIDGILYATGGRVIVCVGVGESLEIAKQRAYKLVEEVEFDGKQYRSDIAKQAL